MKKEIQNIILIIVQIALLQTIFILPLLICSIFITPANINFIIFVFSFNSLHPNHLVYVLVYFGNALLFAVAIRFIVEKYKVCWDFATTTHIIQYVIIILATQTILPSLWWIFLTICSCTLTIIVSEHLCKAHEMQEITFTNSQLITPIPMVSISIGD
ncbi:Protein SYS1-like protein [Entamoeba marina]